MIKGFKEFIMRGNVIDLAVAVVVGAAFAALVGAFSKGLIEPVIGIFLGGGVDAGKLVINGQVIDFTLMINALITFVVTLAIIYFVFVVPMNKWRERKGEESVDTAPADIQLLEEIRDLLKQQRP
jgi:large conductance mechanosensitive channel